MTNEKFLKPELIVFDWSGVISDDRLAVYKANMRILKEYGKPIMTFKKWLSMTARDATEFLETQGVKDSPEKLVALYQKCLDSEELPKSYPDAYEVMRDIKKLMKNVAVLSSHPEKNLFEDVRRYRVDNFFTEVIGGTKNKVLGLHYICDKFNIKKGETIYLGDTSYDIVSAREAGVIPAAISTGYHMKEDLSARILYIL